MYEVEEQIEGVGWGYKLYQMTEAGEEGEAGSRNQWIIPRMMRENNDMWKGRWDEIGEGRED
jgi:hypothetical protein